MRLFVSVDPPKKIRQNLADLIPDISGIRKTPAIRIHLTLVFLGEIPEDTVPEIIACLDQIQFKPFEITIRDVGAFPDSLHPTVLWAGVDEVPELMKLQKKIFEKLAAFLQNDSDYAFHPHITLARVKDLKDHFRRKIFSIKPEVLHFHVREFCLKKSVLGPEGAIHDTIKTFIGTAPTPARKEGF